MNRESMLPDLWAPDGVGPYTPTDVRPVQSTAATAQAPKQARFHHCFLVTDDG